MSLICENLYSMEGSMSPAPALIALKRVYNFCLLVDEAHSYMSIDSAGRGTFNRWQNLGYDCPFAGVDVMTFTFSNESVAPVASLWQMAYMPTHYASKARRSVYKAPSHYRQ